MKDLNKIYKDDFFLPRYDDWMTYTNNECYIDVMAKRMKKTFLNKLEKRYRNFLKADGTYNSNMEVSIRKAAMIEMRYLELTSARHTLTCIDHKVLRFQYEHLSDKYDDTLIELGLRIPYHKIPEAMNDM